jgi:5-methylcytosine-specific restriction endonuclease McrA
MCNKPIKDKAVYCSVQCRRNYWNKNDYHLLKKKRIWVKKEELIKRLGGQCKKCGITDMRVLDINHIDRSKKIRPKKGRYSWGHRFKEWLKNIDNLELLCANCHRIHTWEQMNYGKSETNTRNDVITSR